ncbi:MAG: hypothetical protein BGO77_06310 [Caedibacter sp. 37-49]|nr:MAG: hypothetical protein BGO77_06310 [Caedibacter sp. 37-49]
MKNKLIVIILSFIINLSNNYESNATNVCDAFVSVLEHQNFKLRILKSGLNFSTIGGPNQVDEWRAKVNFTNPGNIGDDEIIGNKNLTINISHVNYNPNKPNECLILIQRGNNLFSIDYTVSRVTKSAIKGNVNFK